MTTTRSSSQQRPSPPPWLAVMSFLSYIAIEAALTIAQSTKCIAGDLEGLPFPHSILPEHYQLTIEPDLANSTFRGRVEILASVNIGSQARIILNVGRDLEIGELEVSSSGWRLKEGEKSALLEVNETCRDEENQLLVISLAEQLERKDPLKVQIDYRGPIKSPRQPPRGLRRGLNRARAPDNSDQGVVTASTTLETTTAATDPTQAGAKELFPCFDGPDLKASFSLELVHASPLQAVSNTRPTSSTRPSELSRKKRVQFEVTPRMSPHSLAFALGQYQTISCQPEGMRSPLVTAYAPLGRAQDAQFALRTICKAIPVAAQYFKREFPLNKLDLVVTSQTRRDQTRGDSWGLLMVTEDFLLTDDKGTSLALRQEIARQAVQALLQQWWGNLVSPKSRQDQWLFDGLLVWRSHLLAAELYPHFNYDLSYLLQFHSPFLDAEATRRDSPISHRRAQHRAGALFKMLDADLSKSIPSLIEQRAYSNVRVGDLIDSLGGEIRSGQHAQGFVNSWTNQSGIPLVSVEQLGQNILELRQERLLPSGSIIDDGVRQQTWIVPIDILFSDGADMTERVEATLRDKITQLSGPGWFDHSNLRHWFKLNTNSSSPFRVNYTRVSLEHLRRPIEQQLLTPHDRYNVIDDLRALYELGHLKMAQLLEVLKWYQNEQNGGVWSCLARTTEILSSEEEDFHKMSRIVYDLFEHVYDEQRFWTPDGEFDHDRMNGRQDAYVELINYNHKVVMEEAIQVFLATDEHLEAFLRKPVYLTVLKRGNSEHLNDMLDRLRTIRSHYDRSLLVNFLLQFAEVDFKQDLLAILNDDDSE